MGRKIQSMDLTRKPMYFTLKLNRPGLFPFESWRELEGKLPEKIVIKDNQKQYEFNLIINK